MGTYPQESVEEGQSKSTAVCPFAFIICSLSVSSSISPPTPCLLFQRHRAICPQHCSWFNLIQPLRSAHFCSDHCRDRMAELSISSPDSGAHLPHLCLSVLPHRHWSPQTRQKHLLLSLCSTMSPSLLYPIILILSFTTLFQKKKQYWVLIRRSCFTTVESLFIFGTAMMVSNFSYANVFAVAKNTG